ncbi:MAG: hypothetical protein LQ348_005447 [Seirophora lacunosa]|nr:MAG: hypothetical protein LQ348_005447 [Seirophora lacunosa]
MPAPPAFRGVPGRVFLLLASSLFLLFSLRLGVSKSGRVDQNLQSTVEPEYEPLPEPDIHHGRNHSVSLVKRDAAADYEAALRTGGQMWAKIQAAFDGCSRGPVQTFQPSALENGWTRDILHIALDAPWREYIDHELGAGKVPPADQTQLITHTQDVDFTNKQQERRQALSKTGLEAARYRTYYLPSIRAVVIKNMRSPAAVVKDIFRRSGRPQPPPSNEVIGNVYAPPLHRWSDVTWVVYRGVAATGPAQQHDDGNNEEKNLQFIGHDQVNNAVSASVIKYVIRRHQPPGGIPNARPSLPFPGLEFGIE